MEQTIKLKEVTKDFESQVYVLKRVTHINTSFISLFMATYLGSVNSDGSQSQVCLWVFYQQGMSNLKIKTIK